MIKKVIVVMAVGVISFGAMFAVAWFTTKTPSAIQAQEPAEESASVQRPA